MMTTDIVHINSDLKGKEEAVITADSFNKRNGLSGKDALHIRLLTEEIICAVHDIMDGFIGNLWLESEETQDGVICRISLSAQRAMSPSQEEQLLMLATSGQNENSMGILGKIREAIRLNMKFTNETELPAEYKAADSWYELGREKKLSSSDKVGAILWSLENYRSSLSEQREANADKWEELERSIIARLSNDVKIWLTDETTEIVIEKRIKR